MFFLIINKIQFFHKTIGKWLTVNFKNSFLDRDRSIVVTEIIVFQGP